MQMKTLVIFDFDDTLFESNSQVIVKNPSGEIKHLTSGEYASYIPHHEDSLDFSQFEGYPPSPKPILTTVSRLRNAVSKHGIENVIILTARGKSQPITQVLRDFSLPQIFVAAVGSSDPKVKADYALRTVNEEDYDKVIVYEDNIRNIFAIKEALVPVIGVKNFVAYNVRQANDSHILVRH